MEAAATGDLILMLECLEIGINVNSQHPKTQMTAIMYAARGGNFDCTVNLLNKGADLNAKDPEGRQAIHFASTAGQIKLIIELVKWAVDLESLDK
jgi:ankyrin repeat protein